MKLADGPGNEDQPGNTGNGTSVNPRRFQVEICQLALRENVIAYLATGSGKTLIAAMLIEQVLAESKDAQLEPLPLVIFLADRVHLVDQQADYITKATFERLRCLRLYGDMGVDCWRQDKWNVCLESGMIIVSTPQVILDGLRHGMIEMSRVGLLIFDEAHHATGGHPYNAIMHEFYFPMTPHQRPKVFGMTASPVKRRGQQDKNRTEIQFRRWIDDLENNLDARIVCPSDSLVDEVKSAAPRPDEFIIEYEIPEEFTEVILREGQRVEESDPENEDDLPDDVAAQVVGGELGKWCAAMYTDKFASAEEWKNRSDSDLSSISITPKVRVLLQLLAQELRSERESSTDARVVVFVRRRIFAKCLSLFLDVVKKVVSHVDLRPGYLVGHESGFMTLRQQRDTVSDFREGSINVIVATDVIEEGLDIPSCNLVVMFNGVITTRSYVQSSGRARCPSSKYVVMVPASGPLQRQSLDFLTSAKCGAIVMNVIARRQCMRTAEKPKDLRLFDVHDDAETLRSKTTTARIPRDACPTLLIRYCQGLPGDDIYSAESHRPVFQGSASEPWSVKLPLQSPIRNSIRARRVVQSKSLGRSLAALEALRALYEIGELDESLFPIGEKQKYDQEMEGFVEGVPTKGPSILEDVPVGPPGALRWDPMPCGHVECEQGSVRGYKFEILDDRCEEEVSRLGRWELMPFCIITATPFVDSDFNVVTLPDGGISMTLKPMGHVCVTQEQVTLARRYAASIKAVAINNPKMYHSWSMTRECGYLFAPCRDNQKIDWDSMREAIAFPEDPFDPLVFEEGFTDHEKQYKVALARHDKQAQFVYTGSLELSWEVGDVTKPYGKHESIAQHYERKHKLVATCSDSHALRFWRFCPVDEKMRLTSTKQGPLLIPEHVKIVPVPPIVVRFAKKLPHFEKYLSVIELLGRLNSPDLTDVVKLARGITPRTSRSNDLNYERLEYLGDAVLKVEASRIVFSNFPSMHEGNLTNERSNVVCNSYLAKRGIAAGFASAIACVKAPVSLKGWPWPFADYSKSTVRESQKVIADCVESVIGLAYVEGGLRAANALMDSLHILTPIAAKSSSSLERRGDPRVSSMAVSQVEKILGYTFRDKSVLVEALTHPSYSSSLTPSLGRLEFLGDAVVGLIVVEYLYFKYQDLPPAALNSLKDPMVSNDFFAKLVLSKGLSEYLWHDSVPLSEDIKTIQMRLANTEDIDDDELWDELKLPKCLADIFESLVGAIYMDCGANYDVVKHVMLPHLEPGLCEYAEPSSVPRHPVADLNILVQRILLVSPSYLFRYDKVNHSTYAARGRGQKPDVICTVLVFGRELGHAKQSNKKKAKKLAARNVLDTFDLTKDGPSHQLLTSLRATSGKKHVTDDRPVEVDAGSTSNGTPPLDEILPAELVGDAAGGTITT